jgi:hypothetical protein
VKVKKTIQDNSHQSRATTFTAAEMGFLENEHVAKLISALEKWYLRKVCYLLFFITLIFYA